MNCPLITIITVCYNAKSDLEETINNVLGLDYPCLDYIIIDGGSTDGTVKLIESYGNKITKWISEKDNGIYDAMNKGWALAEFDSYIIYLGAGDKLISLPSSFNERNAVYYGNVLLDGNFVFNSKADWRIRLGNTLHHQALLVPKFLHPSPPFSLNYPVYADFDFNQRLYLTNTLFIKNNELFGYAKPDGVSSVLNINEMTMIVNANQNYLISIISKLYLCYQKYKYILGSK